MIRTIKGAMFAGKSKLLIETYIYYKNQGRNILVLKPSKDTRDKTYIRSRDLKFKIPANVIKSLDDIYNYNGYDLIIIDEIQFLTGNVRKLLIYSIENNIDFIFSGLSLTSELKPFGIMPEILTISDEIINLQAKCNICNKNEAIYTMIYNDKNEDIKVGDKEYFPICKECLKKKGIKNYE